MRYPGIPEADLRLLRQYDTPTICNVVELFDQRPRSSGFMDGRIQACFPKMPPMVGYAATATFRSAWLPRTGGSYGGLADQVASFAELPGPAVVVFQDLDDPPAAATFGEVMCSTYKAFGAAGLITSGAGRDLDQVEAIDFPCFTGGTICAHGYCHFERLGGPIRVGGLLVEPGDLLHGDRNGITNIPISLASATAHACAEFAAAESIILGYVRSGNVSPEGFAEAHRSCKDKIEQLRQRLRATIG